MITVASVLLALVGLAMLVLAPMPRERARRMMHQALGTMMFTTGLVGFVLVVFVDGRLVG